MNQQKSTVPNLGTNKENNLTKNVDPIISINTPNPVLPPDKNDISYHTLPIRSENLVQNASVQPTINNQNYPSAQWENNNINRINGFNDHINNSNTHINVNNRSNNNPEQTDINWSNSASENSEIKMG